MLLYLLLVIIGWLAIYATSYSDKYPKFYDLHTKHGKQLLWIGTAWLLAFVVMMMDSKVFTTFSYFIYALVLLLMVTTPFIGKVVNGQRNWIAIGSFEIQPAEFGKLAATLAFAKFMSGLNINMKTRRTRFIGMAVFSLPAILVLLTGDTGSALVYLSFFLVMYRFGLEGYWLVLGVYFITLSVLVIIFNHYLSKYYLVGGLVFLGALASFLTRRRFLLMMVWLGLSVFSIFYVFAEDYAFKKILKPHQQERIEVMLGIPVKKKDADYNVRFSKIAIGSGGFWGKGFLQGTVTGGNFVPEQPTDFIYSSVGEEFGFWGSTVVILLFLTLFYRILRLAERQRSMYSRVYAYGVACILFFHLLINIGMTIGFMPVIGIPLPFLSYGGSSLWTFTVLLFILIKLDSDRQAVLR